MRKFPIFISKALILSSSIFALAYRCGLDLLSEFWFFMINLIVISVLFPGGIKLLFLNKNKSEISREVVDWKKILGVVVLAILILIACFPEAVNNFHAVMGYDDEIYSKSWYKSGNSYFVVVNKGTPQEINKEQFDQLNFVLKQFFSLFWIFFSCMSVVIWTLIGKNEKYSN